MDAAARAAHRGHMLLHDTLLILALVAALVLLDVAALRWGEDTRRPELLRDLTYPDS
jgi:hypothetical protein